MNHPCKGKCTEFSVEQCRNCLVDDERQSSKGKCLPVSEIKSLIAGEDFVNTLNQAQQPVKHTFQM